MAGISKFMLRIQTENDDGTTDAPFATMDGPDAALLAAAPSIGDTVIVPFEGDGALPACDVSFKVRKRVYTFAEDCLTLDVLVESIGLIPRP